MRRRRPVDEDSSVPRVACHVLHAKTLRVARHAWCCIARCWPEGERRDSTTRPHLPNPTSAKDLNATSPDLRDRFDSALTACCEGRGACGGRGLVAGGTSNRKGCRTVAMRSCELQQSPEPPEREKQRHDGNTHALRAAGRGCLSKATCHSHSACCMRCCLPQQCQTGCALLHLAWHMPRRPLDTHGHISCCVLPAMPKSGAWRIVERRPYQQGIAGLRHAERDEVV